MLFNSIEFALFLPVVFALYWAIKPTIWQNVVLFISSYFFYACWDWRFMFLLLFSTALDYFTAIMIEQKPRQRVTWFWLSIAANLGFLGFFKYYNFFAESMANLLAVAGIILPVGISFYTFHGLSYMIDVYKGRIKPERNFVDYAVFVSFFPLLVAGPIERATHLLPQVKAKRRFNEARAVEGMRLILWGFFKKIMIADRLAIFVNSAYADIPAAAGAAISLATVFFALQLYLDFSAYSDIATGVARLLDFDLIRNFRRPYFSTSFGEFWTRWHISLSSWFRDYVYIPLGGGKSRKIRNVAIVFLLSGLWHGASWNFVIWGILNGLALVVIDPILTRINGFKLAKTLMVATCWTITLVFFRAGTLADAAKVFQYAGIDNVNNLLKFGLNQAEMTVLIGTIVMLFTIESALEKDEKIWKQVPEVTRWLIYFTTVLAIIYLGQYGNNESSFIYFQF
jgi:alginate O-acetyltransferase complex protein AlgI